MSEKRDIRKEYLQYKEEAKEQIRQLQQYIQKLEPKLFRANRAKYILERLPIDCASLIDIHNTIVTNVNNNYTLSTEQYKEMISIADDIEYKMNEWKNSLKRLLNDKDSISGNR